MRCSAEAVTRIVRILLLVAALAAGGAARADVEPPAVLVTGASSGIGLSITRLLATNGYFVYAGARKDADIERLDAMDNVEALRLDVTYPEHIEAAVARVRAAGRGLHGVVNNAGVASVGPLIETDIEELEWLFDVNVYGPYRITRAFAPLLLESGGRVVNISSISGILSSGMFGHYSMSKHALEAYTDALAAELVPLGVHVSAVEPGNFRSDIGETVRRRIENGNIDLETSRFADRLRLLVERVADRERYDEPDAVARAVEHALFDPRPKRRYLVTPNRREAEITIAKAIEELVQLNEDHAWSFEREELVLMLDQALQRSRLARAD